MTLKKCHFDDNWEALAQDRSKWRTAVHCSIATFERSRSEYAGMKLAVRKKQHHPLIAQTTTFPCPLCNRILLTRAGLTNHLKWHRKKNFVENHSMALHVHDFLRCDCSRCRHTVSRLNPEARTQVVHDRRAFGANIACCAPLVHDVLRCNCRTCKLNAAALTPENQCANCGKICKSKGGLKLHQKVHNK